jgi:hypothetical protein
MHAPLAGYPSTPDINVQVVSQGGVAAQKAIGWQPHVDKGLVTLDPGAAVACSNGCQSPTHIQQ